MIKNKWRYLILVFGVLLIWSNTGWAAKEQLGEIKPGIYSMAAISNHTPVIYKKAKEYWESLQKVELLIAKPEQFKDIPKLGLKEPYVGNIVLGDKQQKFGIIVDIVGEEKRLYIDKNGDGSFANESWAPLINEWLGIQNYWVTSPEPIDLQVAYNSLSGGTAPIQVFISGVLLKPGAFVKEKPYLLVKVRTWFLAKVPEDGIEKYMAVVDHNNNGCFNDPEDMLIIDYDDDEIFSLKEAVKYKKGIKIRGGKNKFDVSWDVFPKELKIGGKDQ